MRRRTRDAIALRRKRLRQLLSHHAYVNDVSDLPTRGELHLRPGRPEDAEAMAAVQSAGWREGFVGIVPAELEPSLQRMARRSGERLQDPSHQCVVAERDGEIRGWCAFGPSRDPDAGAATGEIYTLYVHPSDWARGIGRVERALQELRAGAFEAVTVWSFGENDRANAFYERRGFRRDGAEQRHEQYGGALEVRYQRSL